MDLARVRWRKSSYSGTQGECVEVAFLPAHWRKSSYSGTQTECVEVGFTAGAVGIRDTKNRDAGHLAVPHTAWTTFTAALHDQAGTT